VKMTVLQHFQPHEGFGGDFFNVRVLDDARIGVLVCDVTGHDVRSALLAATINGLKEQLRSEAARAGNYITALNRRLHGILETTAREMFATAFYLVADVRSANVCCVRAGHPKGLLRRADGTVEAIGNAGPALGLFEEAQYESEMVGVAPGDRVFLFTDGLYETVDEAGDELGPEGLAAIFSDVGGGDTETVIQKVVEQVHAYSHTGKLDDDVCVVMLVMESPSETAD